MANRMMKREWISFSFAPCGTIGNVDVYKIGNGYVLVEQYDSSKFMYILGE